MLSSRYIYRTLGLGIAFATTVTATQQNANNTNTNAASMIIRLADVQQCPVSPKPMCSDDSCQGSILTCATQFLCSNESPFPASGGRNVVLAGCRCCPLPIQVHCYDHKCGASEGTRICVSEQLQGCACQTGQDRLAAIEAEADDYLWRSDDSVELDLEPSSDENEEVITTTSSNFAAMATRQALGLWLLQDSQSIGMLRKR